VCFLEGRDQQHVMSYRDGGMFLPLTVRRFQLKKTLEGAGCLSGSGPQDILTEGYRVFLSPSTENPHCLPVYLTLCNLSD